MTMFHVARFLCDLVGSTLKQQENIIKKKQKKKKKEVVPLLLAFCVTFFLKRDLAPSNFGLILFSLCDAMLVCFVGNLWHFKRWLIRRYCVSAKY